MRLTLAQRLDAAPWQRLHTVIVVALGAGWLFDSFEVQMFSSAVGPLGDHFHASVFQRDAVLAVWLVGILLGAVSGGFLTDRFGRRRLFVLTLLWYAGFTVLTGLSPSLGYVYALRFLAALGVGAEYSVINAAIAEFVPARVRGRVNAFVMNFWPAGAIIASLLGYLVLDTLALQAGSSWRVMFVLGGVLALVVLYFRRRIPESPRWLVARCRRDQAEAVVGSLAGPARDADPAAAAVSAYDDRVRPLHGAQALVELLRWYGGRVVLGATLDVAEAFGYYGIFALLSVVVLPRVNISANQIPAFYIVGNLGGLAGGLVMARFFDRVGHRRTVATCYLLSAAAIGGLAWATSTGSGIAVTAAFVVSNACGTAAWTSAYPLFTELFPTRLRGAGVGASVAVGRVGAIVGTLLLPSVAVAVGPAVSYLMVGCFWLAGAAAVGVHARFSRGADPARRSLEAVARIPQRAVTAEAGASP